MLNNKDSERSMNFPEVIDGLITHMNKTRTLFLILIITSLVLAPVSIIFAVLLLSPGITSEIGSDYAIVTEPHNSVSVINFTTSSDLDESQLYGLYVGGFVGQVFGDGVSLAVSDSQKTDSDNAYTGEFVGKFDGHSGMFVGEFVGNHTGKFVGNPTGELETARDGVSDSQNNFGIYQGTFTGEFTGLFSNFEDQGVIAQKIQSVTSSNMTASDAVLGYVQTDNDTVESKELTIHEFIPNYMMIGDGNTPFVQTDITLLIVAFIIVVIAASAIILYVGMREMIFFSKWNDKFRQFTAMKKQIDLELDD